MHRPNLRAQRATRYLASYGIATYLDSTDRAQINLALYTYMKCQKLRVAEGYLWIQRAINWRKVSGQRGRNRIQC